MDIDAVISYVNNQDPNWQKVYAEAHPELVAEDLGARYRDYGTLPYLLRGIAKNMPWIRNVYLIVKFDSQVPSWIDRANVNIVLEDQIIPSEFLPTFNSTTIEAFFHRIPGLAEHFIYFNDDMFPMNPLDPEDFFVDGRPVVYTKENMIRESRREALAKNPSNMMYPSATKFVADRLGYQIEENYYMCVPHIAQAFRKSTIEKMHEMWGDDIRERVTKFRDEKNLAHYAYSFYEVMTGQAVYKEVPYAYLRLVSDDIRKTVFGIITNCSYKLICVNDVNTAKEGANDFNMMKNTLLCAFNNVYRTKSKYEAVDQPYNSFNPYDIIYDRSIPLRPSYPHMSRAISNIVTCESYKPVLHFSDINCGFDAISHFPYMFTILFKDHAPVRAIRVAPAPGISMYVTTDKRIAKVDLANEEIVL